MAWVRPGVFEAKASRFCCVRVLMQVDLPALERPTKATSGTPTSGRCSSRGAVVRKRAVCSQPRISAAGGVPVGGADAAGGGAGARGPGDMVMALEGRVGATL